MTDKEKIIVNIEKVPLLNRALATLEKMKENGSFFSSAIEWNHGFDGDMYAIEIDLLIKEIREEITPKKIPKGKVGESEWVRTETEEQLPKNDFI